LPLAFAACGGGTSSGDPVPAAPPRAGFDALASSICAELQRDATAVTGGTRPSDEDLGSLIEKWEAALDRLERLDVPENRAAPVEQMLTHYRRMVRAFTLLVAAEDETVLAAVAGLAVEGQRGTRAAKRAGLARCALFPEIEQPPRDPEPTLEATRQLVPAAAVVLRRDVDSCPSDGSCIIEFRGAEQELSARIRSAVARLRAEGWQGIDSRRTPTGGAWVRAYRNDHTAMFDLISFPAPAHCRHRAGAPFCRDTIWVHRVDVPDVLTGG
jgi:hypothetical protein